MDYTERLRCLAINDARLAEDWVGTARVEADARLRLDRCQPPGLRARGLALKGTRP